MQNKEEIVTELNSLHTALIKHLTYLNRAQCEMDDMADELSTMVQDLGNLWTKVETTVETETPAPKSIWTAIRQTLGSRRP